MYDDVWPWDKEHVVVGKREKREKIKKKKSTIDEKGRL